MPLVLVADGLEQVLVRLLVPLSVLVLVLWLAVLLADLAVGLALLSEQKKRLRGLDVDHRNNSENTMLRGTITFKCTECENTFRGLDCEWQATIFTAPCKCPQCGSYRTMPLVAFFQKPLYRKIWESIEKTQNQKQ